MDRLSVLTINLWHDSPPYEARAAGLRRWLTELSPDLISFQEALRGDARCQVSELLRGLGYDVAFGPVVPFWKGEGLLYGNALASRLPIEQTENHPLPRAGSRAQRALVSTRIRTPAGPLRFVGTHLNHRGRAVRALQARAVLTRVEARPADEAVAVVAGDFNAAPGAPELEALRRRLCDVFAEVGLGRGITWSSENPQARVRRPPGRRIDYVWVAGRPGGSVRCEPLACRVVCHEPHEGVFPSDHFGVYAELGLRHPRAGSRPGPPPN